MDSRPQGDPVAPGVTGNSDAESRDFGFGQHREDLLHHDPLLDCLVELARIHGRPNTRASLSAGLPVAKSGLTPALLPRAAARAGLTSKAVRLAADKIDPALLPAILLPRDNQACLLLEWSSDRKSALLLFPESGQGDLPPASRTKLM